MQFNVTPDRDCCDLMIYTAYNLHIMSFVPGNSTFSATFIQQQWLEAELKKPRSLVCFAAV
jgi:hypothetical protein